MMVRLMAPVLEVLPAMAPMVVQMVGLLHVMSLFLGAAMGADSGKRNFI